MRSPAYDVAELLHDAGIGSQTTRSGWRILVAKEQAYNPGLIPHTTITIYDLPGAPPDYRPGIERPAVQVRVRGAPGAANYPAAYNKAREIQAFLLDAYGVEVGGARYIMWEVESAPAPPSEQAEVDENDRPIVVATYVVQREAAEGS